MMFANRSFNRPATFFIGSNRVRAAQLYPSENACARSYNCNPGNLEQARMMAESQSQMAGGTGGSHDQRHLCPMLGATTIVLLIAAFKLVVHLYAGPRDGSFGDEVYFPACILDRACGSSY